MRIAPSAHACGVAAAVAAVVLLALPPRPSHVPVLTVTPALTAMHPTPPPVRPLRYRRLTVAAAWTPGDDAGSAVFWGVPADLNAADATALQSLRGLGPTLSAALLSARDAHGGFTTWRQVDAVRGVGSATLAQLQQAFYISGALP